MAAIELEREQQDQRDAEQVVDRERPYAAQLGGYDISIVDMMTITPMCGR